MLIDMEMDASRETKTVVSKDSLTGTLSIPDRADISGPRHYFSFALDEKGIVLVDDSGYAEEMILRLSRIKKWRLPGLERLLYDLPEMTIIDDLRETRSICVCAGDIIAAMHSSGKGPLRQ